MSDEEYNFNEENYLQKEDDDENDEHEVLYN
jgi:hypothetical protein